MPRIPRILSIVLLTGLVMVSLGVWISAGLPTPDLGSRAGAQNPQQTVWRIAVSANCNNRDACRGETFVGQPISVGGIWGSMELNQTGGRAEFTSCNGSASPGAQPGDTVHVSVQITAWDVSPSGTFLILSGSEVVRGGSSAGSVLPIIGPVDTGIRAAPGHYTSLVGSQIASAPGVHVEVQVVELSAA